MGGRRSGSLLMMALLVIVCLPSTAVAGLFPDCLAYEGPKKSKKETARIERGFAFSVLTVNGLTPTFHGPSWGKLKGECTKAGESYPVHFVPRPGTEIVVRLGSSGYITHEGLTCSFEFQSPEMTLSADTVTEGKYALDWNWKETGEVTLLLQDQKRKTTIASDHLTSETIRQAAASCREGFKVMEVCLAKGGSAAECQERALARARRSSGVPEWP